ncbi:hypothetical protein L484_001388 [Morus notabilis]|uniref:Uncharacterized protein n=1 Tax=Morus notabilis TaxID=981085 RepID=W9RFV8_9ROSA|nr:uncharacterized protein LOC21384991 [Morus notabilis]EXB54050.1 hypothetical protein L484_001388 [Morus notabilis]
MGNCMETCNQRNQAKEMHDHDQRKQEDHDHNQRDETEINGGPFVKESSLGEKGKLRVKIVVTKEELEWLMVQLNNKGGKSLEDVLGEIERGRAKVEVSWKPSLESIMECPEVVEMDR